MSSSLKACQMFVLSLCCFDIALDVHGVLEGESVVGKSRGIRNLWRSEKFFVIPDSSVLAYDFSLWPIITTNTTAKRTVKDRIGLVRRALSSGYYELHIYAGQLPPSWTLRENVRHHESRSRILHVAHPSDPVIGPVSPCANIRATEVRRTVHNRRYAQR